MANVIVFGAEVNWWRRARPAARAHGASPRTRASARDESVPWRRVQRSALGGACAARARWRVLALPGVAELRDRALSPVRDEDRVEAEALAAARLVGDAARAGRRAPRAPRRRARARRARRRSARRRSWRRRSSAVQHAADPGRRRPSAPSRMPGRAAERLHLDARSPRRAPTRRPAPSRARSGPSRARSRRTSRRPRAGSSRASSELELPARRARAQLVELVRVAGGEPRPHCALGEARRAHAVDRGQPVEQPNRGSRPAEAELRRHARVLGLLDLDRLDLAAALLDRGERRPATLAARRELDRERACCACCLPASMLCASAERPERQEHERGGQRRRARRCPRPRRCRSPRRPRATRPSSGRAR